MTSQRAQGPQPYTPRAQQERKKGLARRCLQLAFVLCLIGLLLGAFALWGQQRSTAVAAWRSPADNIQVTAIARDLALLSLAGVPDDQVLTLAMEKGELATVHAVLALSADLSDYRRISGWMWLARHHAESGFSQQAAQAYRLAGSGAILSPDTPDLLRTETLLTAGRALIDLYDWTNARLVLKQAALIGARSPRLNANYRQSLLENLMPASLRAGGSRDDWAALAKAVKNGAAHGSGFPMWQSGEGADWREAVAPSDALLIRAQDTRRLAAAGLLEALSARPDTLAGATSGDAEQETVLRVALLDEDTVMDRYVEEHNTSVAIQARLRWLLLKRAIALGAYGAGLVPEWESNPSAIDAAVTVAWTEWLTLQAEPGLTQQLNGTRAYQALTAAYWGLYPEAPVTDLIAATQATRSFGGSPLTILESGVLPAVGWSE